jgi:dual specificity phosphatase 12
MNQTSKEDKKVEVSKARENLTSGFNSQTAKEMRMFCIDKNLYLGNLEAATNVLLLGWNGISHMLGLDYVPLPQKISSMIPRLVLMHLKVADLPHEDLLSCLSEAIRFVDTAMANNGVVLIYCFRGQSCSATLGIAYLMHKYHYKFEKALQKVKSKCSGINPQVGFIAQLKMFESMNYSLDSKNLQYKMFKLYCVSEKMRKAKVLFRDSLDKIMDSDPAGGLPGSAEAATARASKGRYPMIVKCRKCRRTLASCFNMLPHVRGETPSWMDNQWSRLTEEDVLDDASNPAGIGFCSKSSFINPVSWMESQIRQKVEGGLHCPKCKTLVGSFSWISKVLCNACGATIVPYFQLDLTETIFRTQNTYLQPCFSRNPVLV